MLREKQTEREIEQSVQGQNISWIYRSECGCCQIPHVSHSIEFNDQKIELFRFFYGSVLLDSQETKFISKNRAVEVGCVVSLHQEVASSRLLEHHLKTGFFHQM